MLDGTVKVDQKEIENITEIFKSVKEKWNLQGKLDLNQIYDKELTPVICEPVRNNYEDDFKELMTLDNYCEKLTVEANEEDIIQCNWKNLREDDTIHLEED